MRKSRTAKKYADIKPWVRKAIADEDELSSESLWKNAPSAIDAYHERLKRIKFLRKNSKTNIQATAVADRLACCEPRNRCCSGACPECGRLFQRQFVRKTKRFIRKHFHEADGELVAVTIVPATPIIQPGNLHSFSTPNLQRRLKTALDKAQLEIALGGIDFSFNEDRKQKYQSFWCPHHYIITTTTEKRQLTNHLRKSFQREKIRIPNPVAVECFQANNYRISYALKMEFALNRFAVGSLRRVRALDRAAICAALTQAPSRRVPQRAADFRLYL